VRKDNPAQVRISGSVPRLLVERKIRGARNMREIQLVARL
jgi:hypothetical protein